MAIQYVPYQGPIVTRGQAKADGLPHFFSGEPCIRQHLSQRYVSTGACLTCQVLYLERARANERNRKASEPDYREERLKAQRVRQERWTDAHREQERERGRRYGATERAKAQKKAWADVHRDQINAANREQYQQKRAADPDGLRAKWRTYKAANKEAGAAHTKRWAEKNAETLKAKRVANRDKIAERSKAWAKANPEKAREKTQRWQERNPGSTQRWRKANPEAARAIKHTRRARENGAEGSHTAAELKALFKRQAGKCIYCSVTLGNGYCADHVVPLVRGGSNWITNIQLLCRSCNAKKWATDPIEFARRLGRLV